MIEVAISIAHAIISLICSFISCCMIHSETFQMNILERPSPNELVFEMIHVDASFVNALRRLLLAEVPTVAIESVYMWKNSSLLHDEVLSHRLGLIPIMADARRLDEVAMGGGDNSEEEGGATDRNTIVFRLAVSCTAEDAKQQRQKDEQERKRASSSRAATSATDPDNNNVEDETVRRNAELESCAADAATTRPYRFPKDRPYTKHVYSSDLEWVPQGDQEERFQNEPSPIAPIHKDILIAKLRPGQSIELEAHCRRGIGKDHAKFSPVATASYRLMPKIEILHGIYDELAQELVHVYEPGVFDLVPTNRKTDPPGTRVKAKVVNPYASTMSRNFQRHPELARCIKMGRIPHHFIFSVESVGMYSPAVLVAEAIRALQAKCQKVMDLADEASDARMEGL
jgi:DNA-directed RNA polymerases I and III subunit RPAC1